MTQAPSFFIPGIEASKLESALEEYAAAFTRPVPAKAARIYSLVFTHNQERWTATVGENLTGIRDPVIRNGRRSGIAQHLSDPATVLAILGPSPYLVFTDRLNTPPEVRSAWENPFLAGDVVSRSHFGGEVP